QRAAGDRTDPQGPAGAAGRRPARGPARSRPPARSPGRLARLFRDRALRSHRRRDAACADGAEPAHPAAAPGAGTMSLRRRWWLFGAMLALLALALVAATLQQHRAQARRTATAVAQRESAQAEAALADRARVAAELLAESLVNPTYFFDLQRIGEVLVGSLNRDDVAYVLLLDRDGRIIHDGSHDIARFGQQPDDAFAARAQAATEVSVFGADRFVEVAHPIALGD